MPFIFVHPTQCPFFRRKTGASSVRQCKPYSFICVLIDMETTLCNLYCSWRNSVVLTKTCTEWHLTYAGFTRQDFKIVCQLSKNQRPHTMIINLRDDRFGSIVWRDTILPNRPISLTNIPISDRKSLKRVNTQGQLGRNNGDSLWITSDRDKAIQRHLQCPPGVLVSHSSCLVFCVYFEFPTVFLSPRFLISWTTYSTGCVLIFHRRTPHNLSSQDNPTRRISNFEYSQF